MRTTLFALFLVAGGVAAYSNSFTDIFAGLDAKESVRDNPYIRHLWPLSDAMSLPLLEDTLEADEGSKGGTFVRRPLLSLTFAVNQALLGHRPQSYQIVNLMIHLTAGLLLFGLVRRTLLLPRFAATWREHADALAGSVALLWTLHPLHTESVTNLVQRAESLMGALYLTTLYATARLCGGGATTPWTILAILACAYGMGTKETMVTAPVAALLYDLVIGGAPRETLRRRWPLHLGLCATWLVLAGLIAMTADDAARDFEDGKTLPYVLSQPKVILHYLRLAFWPDALHVYVNTREFLHVEGVTPMYEFWVPAVSLAGALLVAAWAAWQRRVLGFVGLAFFLYLSPSSSVVATSDVLQEHRTYLALACVIVVVIAAGHQWLGRWRHGHRIGIALVALTALGLAVRTHARNVDYHSEFGMIYPGDLRQALVIVARHEFAQGEIERALTHFDEALVLVPEASQRAEAYYDLGNLFLRAGRRSEAKYYYEAAVYTHPPLAAAHNNLGALLAAEGDLDGAEHYLRLSTEHYPLHFLALANLGLTQAMRGERDDALAQLRSSLELVPVFEIAAKTLAWLEALPADLEPRCRLLVELAPGYADAYLMRDNGPGEECR